MMHTKHRWLIVPVLLALAACSGGDKYPFPPQFVSTSDVSPRVLGAPPEPYSTVYTTELDGILARQATLTDDEKATLLAEDHITPRMIVEPVLGKEYTAEAYPALFTLLRHAASDAWRDGDAAQDYWHRDRPWVADARVQLLVESIKRPSYPSGHSTTNHIWAHVLSDLFPEKEEALFARAYEIGLHRTWAGVHFPSDIEAGKRYAAYLYGTMQSNPQFQTELAAARTEIDAAATTAHADDDVALPQGKLPTSCMTPQPGTTMTMCP